jgi:hypothetical protein
VTSQTARDILELMGPLHAGAPPPGSPSRVPADSYRRMSGEGLRQNHAHGAAERPDGAASFVASGSHLHLWSRRGPDDAPWVALATSVSPPDRLRIDAGFRVIADGGEQAAALASDPARALAELVVRHGVSYFSGSRRRVYLLPEHVIDLSQPLDRLSPAEFQRAVALEEPPEGARLAVNVALSTTAQGSTRLAWFFVLDLTAYSAEVAARRR